MTETGDRLHLLFDWASAQDNPRRLALWLVVAVALHAAAYLFFRVTYPPPQPVRISDAAVYVLPPNSPEVERLAPLLASEDPSLFAPEKPHGYTIPAPAIPVYEPSYSAATPRLEPLPDPRTRILPPLRRNYDPVPVDDAPAAPVAQLPEPARDTQIVFSALLQSRAPQKLPKAKFVARPGDQLAPARFLIAVAPDGRVLHVIKDGSRDVLDDAASRFLMNLWFRRGPDSEVVWGEATFHWGLDVKREEIE